MAFALTRFKAYGERVEGAVRPHVHQVCELHITAANTDIAYDIGTAGGTFWTAVLADATYGSLGTQAKYVVLTSIAGIIYRLIGCDSEANINNRLKQASGSESGTGFSITVTSKMPTLTYVSGSAPTSMVLVLKWILLDGYEAVVSDLGAQVT